MSNLEKRDLKGDEHSPTSSQSPKLDPEKRGWYEQHKSSRSHSDKDRHSSVDLGETDSVSADDDINEADDIRRLSTTRSTKDNAHKVVSVVSGNGIIPVVSTDTATFAARLAPPEGGYGWVIVVASLLINACSWGVNSTYSVYLAHYLNNNVFPGATSTEYSFVGGLSVSIALLIAPLVTSVTRVFGTRTTLLLGVLFQAISLIGSSFATQIWQLFLSQGVCFGLGLGFLFVGSVPILPQWFLKKRSLTTGIAAAGSGVGGLVFSLSTQAMIENISLQWAFRITAIVTTTINLICAFLLRDRNKHIMPSQLSFDVSLFKRPEFLLLLGWGCFSMLGYVDLVFIMAPYAESVGLSAQKASIVTSMVMLGMAIGRPLVGLTSDKLGRMNIALVLTFFTGLICLVFWVFAKTYAPLIVFALLCGAVCGTFWATISPVCAEVVGLKHLPSALSINWLILVLPTTFSTAIGLKLKRGSGDEYLYSQIFVGIMFIVASICLLFLRIWKIKQMRRIAEQNRKHGEEAAALPRVSFGNIIKV
jgi:MFS family permease